MNFCSSCPFYGFYSMDGSDIIHDKDFHILPISCKPETAFEMAMFKQLDAKILSRQLPYKQRSKIYNVVHEYKAKKKVSGDVGHIKQIR